MNKDLIDLVQENLELRTQLAEKDKEIESWKENSKMWENWKETYYKKLTEARQQLKDQRHQICEEIRNKSEDWALGPVGKIGYMVRDDILDQIEGE